LFLLAILNSSVAGLLLDQICDRVQASYLRIKSIYLSQVPIPDVPPSERQAIEWLVRRLLELLGEGPEAVELERELNERVYRLFGLTGEEIALVEGRHDRGSISLISISWGASDARRDPEQHHR
jgi:hypothetical protein